MYISALTDVTMKYAGVEIENIEVIAVCYCCP